MKTHTITTSSCLRTCVFLLSSVLMCLSVSAREYHGNITYNSYHGLVMAGYQGWFNAPDDGAGRGWAGYECVGKLEPGYAAFDFWPDVSEYEKVYPTSFHFEDGSVACLPSPYDSTTVDTHFRWMKEYGLDGVFMQRFVRMIKSEKGRNHFNHVLDNAMAAANHYDRAIDIMYDLTGIKPGEEQDLIADIKILADRYNLFNHAKNPSYLYHNGKPLVVVWGVGFVDHRAYGLNEAQTIISALKGMGFSVMLGVPTFWRELKEDAGFNPRLHEIIKQCDIIMPWFVGRYNEKSYGKFHKVIKDDLKWAEANHVEYAPLCFPGFSWENRTWTGHVQQIPRNKGKFFKKQLDFCVGSGAKMLYIAMFDEVNEGTAIYKISRRVPAPISGSTFIPLDEGMDPGYYMKLAGDASRKLKRNLKHSGD